MIDEQTPWHDSQPALIAAAVAALLLVAVLVYAVFQVADGSSEPPGLPTFPPTSSAGSSQSVLKTPGSTSYSVPRPQTSEPNPAPAPAPEAPVEQPSGPADETTSTTIYNPYPAPSSSSSAGHV